MHRSDLLMFSILMPFKLLPNIVKFCMLKMINGVRHTHTLNADYNKDD